VGRFCALVQMGGSHSFIKRKGLRPARCLYSARLGLASISSLRHLLPLSMSCLLGWNPFDVFVHSRVTNMMKRSICPRGLKRGSLHRDTSSYFHFLFFTTNTRLWGSPW
jgi:hypothetical protein